MQKRPSIKANTQNAPAAHRTQANDNKFQALRPRTYSVLSKNNRHINHYKILAYSRREAVRCYARLDCIHPDHAAVLFSVSLLKIVEVIK